MERSEWLKTSEFYQKGSVEALRAAIFMEEAERLAQACSRSPWLLFEKPAPYQSSELGPGRGAPMALMGSESSAEFCERWAGLLRMAPPQWEELARGTVGLVGGGFREGFEGNKQGRNLVAMFRGWEKNPTAPKGFAQGLMSMLMDKEMAAGHGSPHSWGVAEPESARAWMRLWRAWVENHPDARQKALEQAGRQWAQAINAMLFDELGLGVKHGVETVRAWEGLADEARAAGFDGELVENCARELAAKAAAQIAQRRASQACSILAGCSVATLERTLDMFQPHAAKYPEGAAALQKLILDQQAGAAGPGRRPGL